MMKKLSVKNRVDQNKKNISLSEVESNSKKLLFSTFFSNTTLKGPKHCPGVQLIYEKAPIRANIIKNA